MNQLLNALRPIMNTKTAKISLEVSRHPTLDDQMVVIAKPIVGQISSKAPQELQVLCAHLATPIKVVGKPEDIEAALAKAVTEQADHRTTWGNRASEIEAQIQAAAQADAKKSTPKTKAGASSPKSAATPASTASTKTQESQKKEDDIDLTSEPEQSQEDVVSGFSL
jgi:PRTRC genetic system protein E